jgi:hypothetical protein
MDTYVGVAPRRVSSGRRDAIERVHALYVDADAREAIAALGRFRPKPAIVVRSGSGRHAYWPLWPPLSPDHVERANRRLAAALGADMAGTDAARILRPPGTFNHKGGTPVGVELEHLVADVFTAREVVGDLPDPGEPRPRRHAPPPLAAGDPLMAIPPAEYVEALTGRRLGRDGKIACPFHGDGTPSLHAYATPEEGWTCFGGCGGGTIIDFGARPYGIEPRGAGFHEIRRRLAGDLLRVEAAA